MRASPPLVVFLASCLLLAGSAPAGAAEPIANEDPGIEISKLEVRLRALTREQLVAEAKAWRDLLNDTAIALSRVETGLPVPDGKTAAGLASEQSALVARFELVIGALREKAGANEDVAELIAEYEAYVGVLSGVDIDVKDAGKLWSMVYGWVTSSAGGIRWGVNLVLFIVVLLAFKILARVLGRITEKAVGTMRQASELLKDFFVNVVRKITFFIGLIVALSMIGVNVGPFMAAIGAVGFIVGFALQGTLGNFASGIMILLYQPYDIGDVVSAGGTTGTVSSMSLVSTTLITPDNQIVVVPNGTIWGGIITNITGSDTRRVDLVAGIGYGDDIAKAQAVLEEILAQHELVLDEPEPAVKVHELADSSVNFIVRPWAKTSDYWTVYWDVTRAIKDRFDEEGISIPYPQQDVHMHQVGSGS